MMILLSRFDKTVLVVDDNDEYVQLLNRVLKFEGRFVAGGVNACEALEAIAVMDSKLVLVDLQIPGIDGLDLTRRLKTDPRTRRVPVVAVAAAAMPGDELRARRAIPGEGVPAAFTLQSLPNIVKRFFAVRAEAELAKLP